jgi:hypothetical protein
MNPKISIILPTATKQSDIELKLNQIKEGIKNTNDTIFNDEFINLCNEIVLPVEHFLEITLLALRKQIFKEFELIIVHKYPEDALDIVKKYPDIKVKLIKEKDSVWHKYKRPTHSGSINTGFIYADGELLIRLDDFEFFNEFYLQEMWNTWKQKKSYITSKVVRRIKYDKDKYDEPRNIEYIGNKIKVINNGWYGVEKPISTNKEISKHMTWGHSSSVSLRDILKINGHDEVFDGNIDGNDMELGYRLYYSSRHKRYVSDNWVYELDCSTSNKGKTKFRDDIYLRNIVNPISEYNFPRHIVANKYKPKESELKEYETYHKKMYGELNPNWKKFMESPMYDLKEERRKKVLGKLIYTNI